MTAAGAADRVVTVRLLALPLALHDRAQQHAEAMQREFRLILEQARAEEGSVPHRLLDLSRVLSERYEGLSDEQEAQIAAALAAGEPALDELVFQLPAHVAGAAEQLGAILDEADEFCRQGRLLTLETPPELVRYRRWYLDNFVHQSAGEPPQPWSYRP
ncbi:MAG: hypothetical protein QOG49_511 [Frankiaceae bacterium]|nr:hypothetical protein [Frankiaceae bacterium]